MFLNTKIEAGLAIVGLALCAATSAALAAPNCNSFFYNADGSWSSTHVIVIAGPASQTIIGPADKLRRGTPGLFGRIAASLDANCHFMVPARGIPRVP
jgi:hypothetical protein